jgi:dihydroxy-acid dehydratase
LGHEVPLLVNLQPAGEYLGEDFHRAGGVPAVVGELMRAKLLPHPDAITVNGLSIGDNCVNAENLNPEVIWPVSKPLKSTGGFINLSGNLFDSAIMKTSVISEEFRLRYLSNADDPDAFEGRAIVFDGPEHFHRSIDDPSLNVDADCLLFMRGTGPKGYPGAAEVVNMRPPDYLIKRGILALACIGDGRQSGTSGSPSILNASPEAADGGGLALLQTGDRVRIDLAKGTANMLISDEEIAQRAEALTAKGGYPVPDSQTPWQQIFREHVRPLSEGMVLKDAPNYQDIAHKGLPRNNH